MYKDSFFKQYPKASLFLLVSTSLCLSIIFTEIILSKFFPTSISVAGFVKTKNGRIYGWGFNPYQLVKTVNPDTGQIFLDRVNNWGWRDRDRSINNQQGAYRIMIIGDSNTFGYIVRKEKTFTYLLESKLNENGFNVEVLNISYPGWGTLQQFESLKREGRKFKPNLVIFAITRNDFNENVSYKMAGKTGRRIPFYYSINEKGQLEKHIVKEFQRELRAITRKSIISKSEILMRAWSVRSYLKALLHPNYLIDETTIFQIKKCIKETHKEKFISRLSNFIQKPISELEITQLTSKFGFDEESESLVLRLAEFQPKTRGWHRNSFYFDEKISDNDWTLFKSLILKAKAFSKSIGANISLISFKERGRFNWESFWCKIPPTKKRFQNFIQHLKRLESLAKKNEIGFIQHIRPVSRARNDPHPNDEGNLALADSIYNYLLENYSPQLPKN